MKNPPKAPPSLEELAVCIERTGFVLEYKVATLLKAAGWTVISNKYYVDDQEEKVREIDLIAYKVTKVQGFNAYTCLIVSCKKSESDYWAFLSRRASLLDPNFEWQPLHTWTNVFALKHQFSGVDIGKKYHDDITSLGVQNVLRQPEYEIFAFQEMSRNNGAPRNDGNIFSSVTSLIKAQAYELGALPERKKSSCVYQFNLLSVVDADMVKLSFIEDNIEASPIESVEYFSRYIVKGHESFARIRFCKAGAFKSALADYDRLHTANVSWFGQQCNRFYDDILCDSKRWSLLSNEFEKEYETRIRRTFRRPFHVSINADEINFSYEKKSNHVEIYLLLEEANIKFLNEDEDARDAISHALKITYRFTGTFSVMNDIPF